MTFRIYCCNAGFSPAATIEARMIKKISPQDLNQSAQALLGDLKTAGVDLSNELGTPGKLWRGLAASSRQGVTQAFLSDIQARSEVVTEIEAARTRFDATGIQSPTDLAFLLLCLFCTSTSDLDEVAGDVLALLRDKKTGAFIKSYES